MPPLFTTAPGRTSLCPGVAGICVFRWGTARSTRVESTTLARQRARTWPPRSGRWPAAPGSPCPSAEMSPHSVVPWHHDRTRGSGPADGGGDRVSWSDPEDPGSQAGTGPYLATDHEAPGVCHPVRLEWGAGPFRAGARPDDH